MRFGRSILIAALAFVLVAQASVLMGIHSGVEADTWSEASASFDGETFAVGGETTQIDYQRPGDKVEQTSVEEWIHQHTPLEGNDRVSDGPVSMAVISFVNGTLWLAFHVAAVAALIGAKVGYLLPIPGLALPTISAVSNLTTLLAVAGVGYVYLRPVVERI